MASFSIVFALVPVAAFAITANIHIAGTNGQGVAIRPTADRSQPELGRIPEGASPDYNCFTYGESIGGVSVWFNVNYEGVTGYYASYYDDSSYGTEAELQSKYGIPKCEGAASTPPPQGPAPTTPPGPGPGAGPGPGTGQPGEGLISINNGAIYTKSRRVQVRATPPPGANLVTLSTDGGFVRSETHEIAGPTTYPWVLPNIGSHRDPITVHALFAGPTSTNKATDDIILDQGAPVLRRAKAQVVERRGNRRSIVAASNAARSVLVLDLSASDAVSKVRQINVTFDGGAHPLTVAFHRHSEIVVNKAQAHSAQARVRVLDGAGNPSKKLLLKLRRAP